LGFKLFKQTKDLAYSPRLGWAVVTNSPRPEWAIVSNTRLEKPIEMLELSKLRNGALCFGYSLILTRERGRASETLRRQGVGFRNPPMSRRQGSWALAFGGGLWDHQGSLAVCAHHQKTQTTRCVPTSGGPRPPAQRPLLDPRVVISFLLFLPFLCLWLSQHIRVMLV